MNSQMIQDNVNKYSYGVLIGNFNEEQFGIDHARKEVPPYFPCELIETSLQSD